MKIIQDCKLEIIVFTVGAVVMILELVGSRILAPFIGTSIHVWTSIIGVILGSLSFGYWSGGKLADIKQSYQVLAIIILSAGILIGLLSVTNKSLMFFFQSLPLDTRTVALTATLFLFGPPSIFLGAVLPYSIRLKIKSVATSGGTVGKLYAISTLGSIFGTFFAGFYLIAFLGTTKILFSLAIALVLVSIFTYAGKFQGAKLIVLMVLIVSVYLHHISTAQELIKGFVDKDTEYSRVWIFDQEDEDTGRYIRRMLVDGEFDSSMFLDSGELAVEYTKYYKLDKHFHNDVRKTLMIGGGGYSYPKYFLKRFPEGRMDVVEIDPKLTDLAKKYFNLKPNLRLSIYHEDGRTFLNRNKKLYDIVYIDAFNSYSIPYQLTTKEAVNRIYKSLNDDGVVLMNIVSAINGNKGKLFRAEYSTFKEQFSQIYIFPIREDNGYSVQNIMLVALKNDKIPKLDNSDTEINYLLSHYWNKEIAKDMPILTDDFSPVEQYVAEFLSGLSTNINVK